MRSRRVLCTREMQPNLESRDQSRDTKNFCICSQKHGPRVPEELTHPSVCIDLIYHTHMIHPVAYHNDTIRLCGFMPDHEPWPTDEKTGEWISVSEMTSSCNKMTAAGKRVRNST